MTRLSPEFVAGATEESRLCNEGLNPAARSVRDVVEGLARLPGFAEADEVELTEAVARIFLRRRDRWRLALRKDR